MQEYIEVWKELIVVVQFFFFGGGCFADNGRKRAVLFGASVAVGCVYYMLL